MNKNIKYGLGLIIVGFVLCTEITGVFPLLNRSGSVNVTNLVFFLINFCTALGYIFVGVRDLKQDRILKKEQELEIKRKKELKEKRAKENEKKRRKITFRGSVSPTSKSSRPVMHTKMCAIPINLNQNSLTMK